ncbi:MAG TPA: hypothetical protein VF703_09000 [Pyrinomonadaceae bacterium]|jgi:hypothetical protein
MTEIPFAEDGERASLDGAQLQYVGSPAGWAGLWPHRDKQIELRIDGDEQTPDARFVQLAEIVLPMLEAVENAADAYLRGFVGDGGGFYRGSWRLQSLRVRWEPGDQRVAGGEFEVTLSVGQDDYGEWSVRFLCHTHPRRELSPYQFSRRQR